jgi:shikimate kinase
MMGSGKTTIGSLLSLRRNTTFIDTDRLIEDMAGLEVERIFELEGEEGFRRREGEAVIAASLEKGAVVATGGGAVTRPENVAVMKRTGTVIWLRATIDTMEERLGAPTNRPLLSGGNIRETLGSLLAERQPAYSSAAEFSIDTDTLTPEEVVELIEAMWNA